MYKGQSLFTIMYVLPIFISNVFIWVLWLLWWLQRKERCSCRPYSTLRVSCGRGINVRETEGAINNGKSREIGNFVHTRHRKKTNKTKNNNTICVGHHSTQRNTNITWFGSSSCQYCRHPIYSMDYAKINNTKLHFLDLWKISSWRLFKGWYN